MSACLAVVFMALLACSSVGGVLTENRIVGGGIAPDGLAPWAVSIQAKLFDFCHFCGGSLISPLHVLTSAHCIDVAQSSKYIRDNVTVLSGTQNLNQGGFRSDVKLMYSIPSWNEFTVKNNLGILLLKNPLELNPMTQLIPLNEAFIGNAVEVTVVGWGRIKEGGPISHNLKFLKTFSLGQKECWDTFPSYPSTGTIHTENVTLQELCTFHSEGQGVCESDSGSGLFNDDGLVGIVSWGLPCAIGAPDVFTRISAYLDWIKSNTSV